MNGYNYGSTDENECFLYDKPVKMYGVQNVKRIEGKEIKDHIDVSKHLSDINYNTEEEKYNDEKYSNEIEILEHQNDFNTSVLLNYFTNNLLSHNIFDPDKKVIVIKHKIKDKQKDSIILCKNLFFYTNNNAKTWEYLGEFNNLDINLDYSIYKVVINTSDNTLYVVTHYSDTGFVQQIYKSKYTLLSAQQESNKITKKVYFSNNNLIIENKEDTKESTIKIFDLGGRVIFNQKILLQKGTNQISLTSQINPNLYLVNIEFKDSKVNIYKLIKGE